MDERELIKDAAPAVLYNTPRPGPQRKDVTVDSIISVPKGALLREVLRERLGEATHRFNHELLGDEERQLLLDRIKRLCKALNDGRDGRSGWALRAYQAIV